MGDLVFLKLGPRRGCVRATSAIEHYERGLALEATDPDAAMAAYQRALSARPDLADAYNNLGRLYHDRAAASGGRNSDVVSGNRNSDAAPGGRNSDAASGGRNSDAASGGRNSDVASGGRNSDAVFGGRNSDVAFGGRNSDVASGNRNSDVASGGRNSAAVPGRCRPLADAEALYRLALCVDVNVALYWFNLGVALEDQGRCAEAITAYERSLALDPHFADAHFNLARQLEVAGTRGPLCDELVLRRAVRHLKRYRDLVRAG